MGKVEVVQEQLAKIQAAALPKIMDFLKPVEQAAGDILTPALGAAFDAGESQGTGPGFTQADIDAAVAAAVDPLNAQIAQDKTELEAAHADADAKLAVLQTALDEMTAKELAAEGAVQGLKDSVAGIQTALDAIKAFLFPAPAVP